MRVDSLVPGRDTGNMARDNGIQYSGTSSGGRVQYFAGLFNGSGINVTDDNNRKDPALRVIYNSPSGLWTGISYFNGGLGAAETSRRRLGFEAIYDRSDWALKGEYIRADDTAGMRTDGSPPFYIGSIQSSMVSSGTTCSTLIRMPEMTHSRP